MRKKIIQVGSTFFSGFLAVVFTHLFCCGFPAIFSLIGVGASTTGVLSETSSHLSWIEHYKPELFIFGGLMLLFSFYTHWRDRHVCPIDGHCKQTKHFAKAILIISTLLYFGSIYISFFYIPSCSPAHLPDLPLK